MVADINSGSIFSLLPPNLLFMAFTLYNLEHVNEWFFFYHKDFCFHNLMEWFGWNNVLMKQFFPVTRRFGQFVVSVDLHNMLIMLAIYFLLLGNIDHRSVVQNWRICDVFWMVRPTNKSSKVHHFNTCSIARRRALYWAWISLLHFRCSGQSKQIPRVWRIYLIFISFSSGRHHSLIIWFFELCLLFSLRKPIPLLNVLVKLMFWKFHKILA